MQRELACCVLQQNMINILSKGRLYQGGLDTGYIEVPSGSHHGLEYTMSNLRFISHAGE